MQRLLNWLFTINHPYPDGRRRGRSIVGIMLGVVVICVLALPTLIGAPQPLQSSVVLLLGILLSAAVIPLARSGRVGLAGWVLVGGIILALLVPIMLRPGNSLIYLVLPVLVASIAMRPHAVLIVLLGVWAVIGVFTWRNPQALTNVVIDRMYLIAMILTMISAVIGFIGSVVTSRAFRTLSEAEAQLAATARELERVNASLNAQVEERTAELARSLSEVESRAEAQSRLLAEVAEQRDIIRDMSMPILPISAQVLVMPLIGALDAERVRLLLDQAVQRVQQSSARYLVLDITGVSVVDSQVAQGLMSVIAAVRLLGAETFVVGIRPEVAQTIISLGLELSPFRTAATLQEGLRLLDAGLVAGNGSRN
jgi:rsbT co-antagonist protein RsbR